MYYIYNTYRKEGHMSTEKMDELYATKLKLWQEVIRSGDFVRGTVVTLARPCVYKNCQKCKKGGPKHPAKYLMVSRGGKVHNIYLNKRLIPKVEEWVTNYKKLKRLIEDICINNEKILVVLWEELKKKGVKKWTKK
jgi:hypothetical protein